MLQSVLYICLLLLSVVKKCTCMDPNVENIMELLYFPIGKCFPKIHSNLSVFIWVNENSLMKPLSNNKLPTIANQ